MFKHKKAQKLQGKMGTKSGSSKKRRDILKGRQAAQATPTPGPKVSVRKNHTADEVCREPLTENDLEKEAPKEKAKRPVCTRPETLAVVTGGRPSIGKRVW